MVSSPRFARGLRALALTLPLFLSTCHKLLGDFEIVEGLADTEEEGVACTAGTFRCAGLWLFSCAATQDAWLEARACASADLCDSSNGRCRECELGDFRCNGPTLETCNQSESGWVAKQTCTSASECNLNSDSCRPCTLGEFQCNGSILQECTQAGWAERQNCGPATACVVGPDKRSGSCLEPVCDPGKYRCNGGQLLRCDPNGFGEVEVANCRDSVLCREGRANELAGMGVLPVCSLGCLDGTVRCDGADFEVCQDNLWQVQQTCPSADQCSASGGCRGCSDGEVECNANRLRRCSGGSWKDLEYCAAPGLCDAVNERCIEPACPKAGQVACLPDGLSRCSRDQSDWQVLDFCASDALCNENDQKCDTPACLPEARRCVDNTYQFCNTSQTGWEVGQACDAGLVCDLSAVCREGGCTAGEFRCNDVYLEQCDGTSWQRLDRCATAALCNVAGGVCNPPVCGGALPNFDCLDRSLRACSPDRDAWVDIDTCADAASCDGVNGACL